MHTIQSPTKIFALLLTFMLIMATASACAGGTATDEDKARAEIITDTILEGIETEDYSLFAQDFSSDMLEAMDEDAFEDLVALLNASIGRSGHRDMVSAKKHAVRVCLSVYSHIKYNIV